MRMSSQYQLTIIYYIALVLPVFMDGLPFQALSPDREVNIAAGWNPARITSIPVNSGTTIQQRNETLKIDLYTTRSKVKYEDMKISSRSKRAIDAKTGPGTFNLVPFGKPKPTFKRANNPITVKMTPKPTSNPTLTSTQKATTKPDLSQSPQNIMYLDDPLTMSAEKEIPESSSSQSLLLSSLVPSSSVETSSLSSLMSTSTIILSSSSSSTIVPPQSSSSSSTSTIPSLESSSQSSISSLETSTSTLQQEDTTNSVTTTSQAVIHTGLPDTTSTPSSDNADSSKNCDTYDLQTSYFGQYGIIVIAICGGITFLCLFILILFVCWPKWKTRNRQLMKSKERMNGCNSELRAISGLYRPRPSLKKSTSCVPTPLAMASDEITSMSSQRRQSSRVKNDDDDEDSYNGAVDNGDGNDISEERKGSQIDPSNVSTFLLRQTSIKIEEEERRKASLV